MAMTKEQKLKNTPVLKGKAWARHLEKNDLKQKSLMDVYHSTYNYEQIFKLAGYYFCFRFTRGYANLTSLKRVISTH